MFVFNIRINIHDPRSSIKDIANLARHFDLALVVRAVDLGYQSLQHRWARRNFGRHLKDNPPKLGSDAISFKKEGYEVALVAIAAFTSTWPVVNLAAGEGNGEEDD